MWRKVEKETKGRDKERWRHTRVEEHKKERKNGDKGMVKYFENIDI